MEDEEHMPGALASLHHDGSARYVRRVGGGRAIVADGRLPLPAMSTGIAIWRAVSS